MSNIYDKFKLKDLVTLKSPNAGGGACLLLQFENTIEHQGDGIAVPLEREHVIKLFKLLLAHVAEEQLDGMSEFIHTLGPRIR